MGRKRSLKEASRAGRVNVGIIADTHAPFIHPDYLGHCSNVFERFQVSVVVHIGDAADQHALSKYVHDPDGHSPATELDLAVEQLRPWYQRFPEVLACYGNHDERIHSSAQATGIPKRFLKPYGEAIESPRGWQWSMEHEVTGVLYQHGTGTSGKMAHEQRALINRQSTVIGHIHSHAGVKYLASRNSLIFGMNVGCGIDLRAYAFAYGRPFPVRPVLGCGVVLDGGSMAAFVPMYL